MYPTTLHPSPVKDGRRVLGEKTANACLSPAHHRPDASPSKRSLLEPPSPKKLLPSPLFAGQKRTIDQVDDQANNGNVQAQNNESRAETQEVHDVQNEALTHSTAHNDDRSDQQQTDATELHVAPSRESDKQQSPADATPLARSPRQEREAGSTRIVPEDPETRRLFIQQKANLLRNRIQNAMHHVKDPQFDRRLSELEAHSRKFPRLSLPETLTPSHQKEAVTPHRQDEDIIMPSSITPRALQPAVEFKPRTEPSSIPLGLSSPPLSTENDSSQDPMKTPTQTHCRTDTAGSLMQLSSPPATVSRTGRNRIMGEVDEQDDIEGNQSENQAVTPSQRGDAVDGLLKLMNTADRREAANAWTG
ncbi:hypothetical protein ANOM_005124 [Aspergillus nomiae NRRL 13137]|uniref:Uncharacterized protein n=1 Tax=Aspergillus nomiae NRRL (strain ATCC 15546 / NRRL 13137 / CBS 260.88 / M93) TaxID=1509407 RepID=A0A0L1J421_ASPN3|nr:uncharacterized protein ANOM_005124 [Aspergillus nomiae NRRL 13137]KNG86489.1 hypothetical protein ANOM_005124 [Aspergillus nomiae NRRL 13137]